MRIQDLLSEEKAKVPPNHRNPVAKNAPRTGAGGHTTPKNTIPRNKKHKKDATMEGVRDLGYDAQSLIMKLRRDIEEKRLQPTREAVLSAARELAGDMDFAPELLVQQVLGKSVAEAGMYIKPGRPGAYGDDYRSSVSGMGKTDSIAYQQDGGANDEGETDAPSQAAEDKPVLKGYYFYNVKPGQEDDARMYGVKQTKSGKWAKAKYSTSGRSFDMQKDGADKAFGQGNWWSPNKTESVDEGAMSELDIEIGDMIDGYIAKYQDGLLDADHLGAMIDKVAAKLAQQYNTDTDEMTRHVSNHVADALGEE